MAGYEDEVIMAAGTFVDGATIELSCDAPIREPYIAYMQGGLTYEYGKLGVMKAIEFMRELNHWDRVFLVHYCIAPLNHWDRVFLVH